MGTKTRINMLSRFKVVTSIFLVLSAGRCSHQLRGSSLGRLPAVPARTTKSGPGRMLMQSESEDAPALERLVGCLVYALPLSDVFEWGHYLFEKFPLLALPFVPLFPVISFLQGPFVSFAIFIALMTFVTRNPSFSRFIRFNALQAVYLDIVLIFPQLISSVNRAASVPADLAEIGSNTVFYAIMGAILYSVFANVAGKTPNEIPIISEAVD